MNKNLNLNELSTKDIYILIRNFDIETGECFIDYNENYVINKSNIVFYLLGKGLIDKSLVNHLTSEDLIKRSDLNEILEECKIENALEKRYLLAELTQGFEVLLKRLFKSYKEYDLSIDQEIDKDLRKEFEKEYLKLKETEKCL